MLFSSNKLIGLNFFRFMIFHVCLCWRNSQTWIRHKSVNMSQVVVQFFIKWLVVVLYQLSFSWSVAQMAENNDYVDYLHNHCSWTLHCIWTISLHNPCTRCTTELYSFWGYWCNRSFVIIIKIRDVGDVEKNISIKIIMSGHCYQTK